MVRAQTVKDADQWQEALERAKAAGQDEGAAQGSGTKVPAGLESLRKVSAAGCCRHGGLHPGYTGMCSGRRGLCSPQHAAAGWQVVQH